MRRSWIERIREMVRLRQYYMTAHATEEMAEDDLNIVDLEHAVLTGRVVQIQKDDPRGNKYLIEGTATDGATMVGAWWGVFLAGTGIRSSRSTDPR